jgi:hypothetical protein
MPNIQPHYLDRSCFFMGQNDNTWFVVHNTAGNTSLQNLENQWVNQCGTGGNSTYGIERYQASNSQPGDIWQWCGNLADGACANCCTGPAGRHAPFFNSNTNYNIHTGSCEGINADHNNEGPTPQAVIDAWIYLISYHCKTCNIPTDRTTYYNNGVEDTYCFADASGGVVGHRDFDSQNRLMCPGTMFYDGTLMIIMQGVNGNIPPNGGALGNPGYLNQFDPADLNPWIIHMWERQFALINRFATANNLQPLPIPRRDTGIFNEWRNMLKSGRDPGPVLGEEYQQRYHMLQDFGAGQGSWDGRNGTPNIILGS